MKDLRWKFLFCVHLTILLFIRVSKISSCGMLSEVETNISIVSRDEWGAREPKLIENFTGKIPFVIIHHSYKPGVSYTENGCKRAMQNIQELHQLSNGWNDIGYSFAVCGDGRIYMGRGFNVIGAHSPRYNDKSIGICIIGDWRIELPPQQMLDATHSLIEYSLKNGYLSSTYKILGHRQVRNTECPGQRLFDEIRTWSHFSKIPYGPNDTQIP